MSARQAIEFASEFVALCVLLATASVAGLMLAVMFGG